LPTLSHRLRARVLDAATSAYRQARRWAQAREAASLLSACLVASFVLSPLSNSSLPDALWSRLAPRSWSSDDLASLGPLSSPQEPNSAWSLRHDREVFDLPRAADAEPLGPAVDRSTDRRVARSDVSPPSDKLLTTLHRSDGWATVQAFQAVRSRNHSTLQRAFAAN
jgi:hypothetical protein